MRTGHRHYTPQEILVNQDCVPEDCKRFCKCSAPLCPLDPACSRVIHGDGDRVCLYLTEIVKPEGKTKLRGVLPGVMVELVSRAIGPITSRSYPIRKRLRQAMQTGSRLFPRPGGAS